VLRAIARGAVLVLLISGVVGMAPKGGAAVTIDMPEVLLAPNQAGQTFEVHAVNHGDPVPVTGIGFNVQVADGGVPAGGRIQGPAITSVDVVTGTVFASNNNGPSGAGSMVPQVYERGTLTSSGSVNLPSGISKVATVVLDTTGFDSGTFTLTLNTVNDRTHYTTLSGNLRPLLIDGAVTIASPPRVMRIIACAPSRLALTFTTIAGVRYRVQRADTLGAAAWANVPHALAADEPLVIEPQIGLGAPQTVYVECSAGAAGFYRIRMDPPGP